MLDSLCKGRMILRLLPTPSLYISPDKDFREKKNTSYHFLGIAHKLHFAEGRVDFLHSVASLPRPNLHCILQRARKHPNIT